MSVNASNQAVAEHAVLGAFVEGLHDDGLLASIAAGEHNHNLARLDELSAYHA